MKTKSDVHTCIHVYVSPVHTRIKQDGTKQFNMAQNRLELFCNLQTTTEILLMEVILLHKYTFQVSLNMVKNPLACNLLPNLHCFLLGE